MQRVSHLGTVEAKCDEQRLRHRNANAWPNVWSSQETRATSARHAVAVYRRQLSCKLLRILEYRRQLSCKLLRVVAALSACSSKESNRLPQEQQRWALTFVSQGQQSALNDAPTRSEPRQILSTQRIPTVRLLAARHSIPLVLCATIVTIFVVYESGLRWAVVAESTPIRQRLGCCCFSVRCCAIAEAFRGAKKKECTTQ